MGNEKALQVFSYKDQDVRTVMIDGEICWIANDVCKVLEHSNSRVALSRLDDDEKGVTNVYTPGGLQEMGYVSESGLYSLIFTSRKSEAKVFKRWVTHEVLPSIRRTGSYSVAQPIHTISDALRDRALLNMAAIPDLYFAMIGEAFKALYNLEAILNRNLDNMAEIEKSLGLCWSPYARDVLHIPDTDRITYPHVCVDGKVRSAWAYSIIHLPAFEKWLWLVYIPQKFPAYARSRAKRIGAEIPQIAAPRKLIATRSVEQMQLF
jgi:prophage antirepressor-like protein